MMMWCCLPAVARRWLWGLRVTLDYNQAIDEVMEVTGFRHDRAVEIVDEAWRAGFRIGWGHTRTQGWLLLSLKVGMTPREAIKFTFPEWTGRTR